MMTINIPKLKDGEDPWGTPNRWWIRSDGQVMITCPKCGMILGIPTHEIHQDGTVHPSVLHSFPECGWHEFVKLEDYQ